MYPGGKRFPKTILGVFWCYWELRKTSHNGEKERPHIIENKKDLT